MSHKRFNNKQELIDFINKYESAPKLLMDELGISIAHAARLYRNSKLVLATYDFRQINIGKIDELYQLYDNETLRRMVNDYKILPIRDFCIKYKIRFATNISIIIRKIAKKMGEPYYVKSPKFEPVRLGQSAKKKIYNAYNINLKLANGNPVLARRLTLPIMGEFYPNGIPIGSESTMLKRIIAEFSSNNKIGILTLNRIKNISEKLLLEIYDDFVKLGQKKFCSKYNISQHMAYNYIKYAKERLGIA